MYNIMLYKEIYINILSTHQYVSWDGFLQISFMTKELIFLTDLPGKPSKKSHTHHENIETRIYRQFYHDTQKDYF